MDHSLEYYKAIHGTLEVDSHKGVVIQEAQYNLRNELKESLYYDKAKRNGVDQSFVFTPSRYHYKCSLTAMPGEDLNIGDIIYRGDEHWLIVERTALNPIQVSGTAWMCNLLLRFQNTDGDIVERFCIYDTGTYSKSEDRQIHVVDGLHKIYIPYDEETKKLYIDKRLAINYAYDKNGNRVLSCCKISDYSPISQSYGAGAHLLILNTRTDEFIEDRDSVEEMICDYFVPEDEDSVPTALTCKIDTKRRRIAAGSNYTYKVGFYDSMGVEVTADHEAVWSIEPEVEGIAYAVTGDSIKVSVADADNLLGTTIMLSVTDVDGLSDGDTCEIEVV